MQEVGVEYAYGMWVAVAVNVAIFGFFALSYLTPKKPREWRSMGVFSAFLVALFTEMYGFPLTIYLITSWLGSRYPVLDPFTHKNGHLWAVALGGSDLAWAGIMIVSNLVLLAGLILMGAGWKLIHKSKGQLVTEGVYRQIRHPQYTGLFLVSLGLMIQWPTLVTLFMWPVLLVTYYRLAKREELSMIELFGGQYAEYRDRTPAFVPNLQHLFAKNKPISRTFTEGRV